MRTLLFFLAGFALMASMLIVGKLFAANVANATRWAVVAFVAVWFVVAAVNMWIGVVKAGYSVGEELPILLLIFGVPAAVAVAIQWRFL